MKSVICELIDAVADKCPDKVAFVDKDTNITYGELRDYARSLALNLYKKDYKKVPMLIYVSSPITCIVCICAAAYIGNNYCVVNVDAKGIDLSEKLSYFMPEVILTDRTSTSRVLELKIDKPIVVYETCVENLKDIPNIPVEVLPADALLTVFTSGSTGKLKGVVISNMTMLRICEVFSTYLELDDCSRLLEPNTNVYVWFSVNVFNVIMHASSEYIMSANERMFPPCYGDIIAKNKINRFTCISTLMRLITDAVDWKMLSGIEVVEFGGASLTSDIMNRWREQLPKTKFINIYGSTEALFATGYEVDRMFSENETIPIGRAVMGAEVILLDEDGKRVKTGEVGEVYIRSPRMSSGYYQDREETAKAFIQNPLHQNYLDMVYRTGDLARENRAGELVYVGRADSMVKRRGFRIELGGIDAKLSVVPGIKECVSLYQKEADEIWFFFDGETDEQSVYEYCLGCLQKHMIPDRIKKVERMPHNNGSKIDRALLQKFMQSEEIRWKNR